MQYLFLIYFFNQALHVSRVFIAHHHEVFTVYVQQLVGVSLGDCSWSGQVRTKYCIKFVLITKIIKKHGKKTHTVCNKLL